MEITSVDRGILGQHLGEERAAAVTDVWRALSDHEGGFRRSWFAVDSGSAYLVVPSATERVVQLRREDCRCDAGAPFQGSMATIVDAERRIRLRAPGADRLAILAALHPDLTPPFTIADIPPPGRLQPSRDTLLATIWVAIALGVGLFEWLRLSEFGDGPVALVAGLSTTVTLATFGLVGAIAFRWLRAGR